MIFLKVEKKISEKKVWKDSFLKKREDQINKSVRWMPWHIEQKKDAAIGETPRGAESTQRTGDIRMGEPSAGNAALPCHESIVIEEATQGIETS